ncbi:MAG: helix-turn-helix transcriptional regulator [Oscillospiraceae bacterium]|nr:helix-turn-helix transcriptional regulator [Oscillospiraceae bacterium]
MIYIYSAGSGYKREPDYLLSRPNGAQYYCLSIFHSKAFIRLNGETTTIEPPEIIVFKRHQMRYYGGCADEIYQEDWLCFDCNDHSKLNYVEEINPDENELGLLLKSLDIPFNTLVKLDNACAHNIANIIKNIETELYRRNKYKAELMDLKIREIFYEWAESMHKKRNDDPSVSRYKNNFFEIRDKIYALHGPDSSIAELAKELNISPSYFKSIYKKLFGISPGQDIINSRIEYACNLLRTENLPVSAIAERCHYSNLEHFIRQFRQHMNCSPSEYKKSL